MRELRVEDALLYLDQVKVEFGDRPHIYNEFLDIMKTFKTQQIDTPGVIRRVSTLFQGNRRLVLGFNTFLPEGYKIELPLDGDGPPVAVFRAPGSNVAHILHSTGPLVGPPTGGDGAPAGVLGVPHGQMMPPGQQQQQQQHQRAGMLGHGPGQAPPGHAIGGAQSPMRQLVGGPQQLQQQQLMVQRGSAGIGPKGRMEPPAQFAQKSRAMSQQHHQQQQQQVQQVQQQTIMVGGGRGVGQPSAEALGQATQMQDGSIAAQQQQPGSRTGGMQPLQQAPASRFENQQQQPEPQGHSPTAPEAQGAAATGQQQGGAPLEFDHAINYVTTIKKRFASEPETYKKFLEILHTYQKEQRGIKEVLDEVSVLFADHPDLLKEFTYFLPDAVQAQAKAQLDAVAKESEARKRAQARQAIMSQAQGMQRQAQRMTARNEYGRGDIQIPFGATQGRSPDQEQQLIESAEYGEVSFAPVRPPRSKELTPAQAAAKEGRPLVIPEPYVMPNTVETIFFQRAKAHLSRKELSSDKTPNQRRHTPYVEFLKCLHLFGAGILNKEELILLLRGLFTQGHAPKGVMGHNPHVSSDAAELLRDFEEILIGRGPYAEQETALKDKSKYGSLRICDIDFTGCSGPTPSYRVYPTDYPKSLFLSFPDQTDEENAILNKKFVCVANAENRSKMADSLEAYDGVRLRHNVYEETMARIEDERYDFDMAIERNAQAMRQIEPLAEEAQNLRQREEKDGQPIGRLQYKLKQNTMNSILINAVGRIYGDRGDEVLQHLLRNPLIVLPIVY
jgi:paired amphipathic helix protein Sin3a